MTLLEIDKPEEINQSINPEVQVHTSRHTNELDKEKDHSSSIDTYKKSQTTHKILCNGPYI